MSRGRSTQEFKMSLRRHALSGVKWTSLSTVLVTLTQVLQTIILARILNPEDFGLMAMVTVVIGFASAYSDLGIGAAIVQHEGTTPGQLSSLYWLNVGVGIILFIITWCVSPLIAVLFREPRLRELLNVISMAFIVVPVGIQFQMLLQKNLQFNLLARQDICSALLGFIVACFCGLSGFGVWSLVWGQLSTTTMKTILSVYSGYKSWPIRLHFATKDLREFISFGLYQMGERTINYLNFRLDQLLIGYLLGPHMLGYYSFAFNLVMQPVSRINPVLTSVAFPLFVKAQHDDVRLRLGYFSLQKFLSMINFPILAGLFAAAPALIPFMFGDQWHPAIVLVQILSFVALVKSTGNPVGYLLLAKGRADLGFKWNALLLCTQLPVIYLAANSGNMITVSIALLALQGLYFWLSYPLLIRRVLGRSLREYLMSTLPAFLLSAAMAISVLALAIFLDGISRGWKVFLQVVCGVIMYAVLNFAFRRAWLAEIRAMITRNKVEEGGERFPGKLNDNSGFRDVDLT